eukprot:GHVS01091779.1.p1 GENE.GHVS01091779.1~~GHVS01091779.1.p1  ORF type:complete len:354 (+),score=75.01 GHVS01091779.1:133-1194(+)
MLEKQVMMLLLLFVCCCCSTTIMTATAYVLPKFSNFSIHHHSLSGSCDFSQQQPSTARAPTSSLVSHSPVSTHAPSSASAVMTAADTTAYTPITAADPSSLATPKTQKTSQQQSPVAAVVNSLHSQSLRGYLRGHKCLFDDKSLPNGNLSFLFRGADSSQRYIYPLEIQTNREYLPGAEAAHVMFAKREESVEFARTAVFGKQEQDGEGSDVGRFGLSSTSVVGEMIYEDIARFHRVLQYGVAAAMPTFMREEVLAYNKDLYAEIGMNFDALIVGVEALSEFSSQHIRGDQWDNAFQPGIRYLVNRLARMQQEVVSSPTPAHSGPVPLPTTWEAPVDPRTLVPLLIDTSVNAN